MADKLRLRGAEALVRIKRFYPPVTYLATKRVNPLEAVTGSAKYHGLASIWMNLASLESQRHQIHPDRLDENEVRRRARKTPYLTPGETRLDGNGFTYLPGPLP